jgi:hypothetical protein
MRSAKHYFLLGALVAGAFTACQTPTAPDERPDFGISTSPRQSPPPRPTSDLSVKAR